jgi:S1-C subfamily serine protease
MGIRIGVVQPILDQIKKGVQPLLKGLAVEVIPSAISYARQMGVSDEWIKTIEKANPQKRQMLLIRHVECLSKTATAMKDLDILLSIDGKPVASAEDVELSSSWNDEIDAVIVRDKQEMTVRVPTSVLDGECTRTVVFWAGATLHEPHRAVRQQSQSVPSQIYVAGRAKGSPSYMYGLVPTQYIVAVNGVTTLTLNEFVEQVKKLKDGDYVRIKTISFDNVPLVVSVKLCHHYWPTSILQRDLSTQTGWKEIESKP